MKTKTLISLLIVLVTTAYSYAVPARRGHHTLTQPDGSTFTAFLYGDEFTRIRKTSEGHAIIQDNDGWWCYASFDSEGKRHNSGWRVGSDVPADVLSASSSIPYRLISQKARLRKQQAEQLSCMNHDVMAGRKSRFGAGGITHKHGLVILAQFRDVKFKHTRNDFERLINEKGYDVNGSTGSVKDYFEAQFNGKVEFSFDVSEIVTVSGNMAYYGANDADGNDKKPDELVVEACRLLDESIDFSIYDDDKDGIVDNVFVFYAGEDEAEGASEDCIWAHSWYIYSGAGKRLTLDGCRIDPYACAAEISGNELTFIGTFCHEFSHTFGLPDMYDTDYEEDGMAAGLWSLTSLMDGGNYNNEGRTPPYFNAIEREYLGLSEGIHIEHDGHFSLSPIGESNTFYRLNTDSEEEYYLFECRKAAGWDAYIGGSGMLVYHIDKRQDFIKKWDFDNTVNAYANHQCADLVEADSRQDSFTDFYAYSSVIGKNKGLFFPYSMVTSITPDGKPALKYWSKAECKASVTGITRNGDNVEFNVTGIDEETSPPQVMNLTHETFDDAVLVNFESDRPYDGAATLVWESESMDNFEGHIDLKPYEPGKYSITVKGLIPAKTYTITVMFKIGDVEGSSQKFSFITRKKPAVSWPFIYLSSYSEDDGTFIRNSRIPLRVNNATDAEEVRWTFDGKAVDSKDGYFTITDAGELKAYVTWKDGSTEVIMKEIVIAE
jgi:M6 family metalloprotease-like protein